MTSASEVAHQVDHVAEIVRGGVVPDGTRSSRAPGATPRSRAARSTRAGADPSRPRRPRGLAPLRSHSRVRGTAEAARRRSPVRPGCNARRSGRSSRSRRLPRDDRSRGRRSPISIVRSRKRARRVVASSSVGISSPRSATSSRYQAASRSSRSRRVSRSVSMASDIGCQVTESRYRSPDDAHRRALCCPGRLVAPALDPRDT